MPSYRSDQVGHNQSLVECSRSTTGYAVHHREARRSKRQDLLALGPRANCARPVALSALFCLFTSHAPSPVALTDMCQFYPFDFLIFKRLFELPEDAFLELIINSLFFFNLLKRSKCSNCLSIATRCFQAKMNQEHSTFSNFYMTLLQLLSSQAIKFGEVHFASKRHYGHYPHR